MDRNEVYVSTNLNDTDLWIEEIKLSSVHWINQPMLEGDVKVRLRHRGPLTLCRIIETGEDGWITLRLETTQRATTSGQSAVLYSGEVCLGGGIVTQS